VTQDTDLLEDATEAADFGPDFRLETYPFYLIGHVDHRYTAEMQAAMGARALSRPVWRTLVTLDEKPGLSIGEIAEITLLKRSTLSRVIDRMEADGLVERRLRAGDNRVVEAHLTGAGRDALTRVSRIAAQQYARATEGLSEAEIAELVRMLRVMLDNLGRSPFE
jgi:DNA-binding MarR family transcriptional regulator